MSQRSQVGQSSDSDFVGVLMDALNHDSDMTAACTNCATVEVGAMPLGRPTNGEEGKGVFGT